ncbi:MAG: OmpA family protein [Verrucomicrobiales bacterium]|nr:OmpA family protein [Verrucomicrobiales bacterium]
MYAKYSLVTAVAIAVTGFACTRASAQFSGDVISSYISLDSGNPQVDYADYSRKLAELLNGYSPQALARIFGDFVPAYASPVSLNEELGMGPVNFPSLSSDLSSGAKQELDKAFTYLTDNPGAKVVIEGHTDANKSYDQALSESRARAAMLYLAELGISVDRMETVGYAGTQPVEEGNSDAAKAANRRIEIKLLN